MSRERLRGWWDAAADLLLGATCPGCTEPGAGLCAPCRGALTAAGPYPVSTLPDFTVISTTSYDDRARRVLESWKEHQSWVLRNFLGIQLAKAVAEVLLQTDGLTGTWLVPMPSAPRAVRRRGLDVTAALAQAAARQLSTVGVSVRVWRGLRVQADVGDQAGLGIAARRRNVAGRFFVRGAVPHDPLILVDDIVTTGATLSEAARTLAPVNAQVLGAAVVADTPRLRVAD